MYLLLVLPRSSVPAVRPAPGPSTCPTFVQLLVLLKIVKCLHCTICHCFTNGDNVAHSPIVALGSIHCFTWYHFVHGAIVSHGAIVVLGAICSTWCHCCTCIVPFCTWIVVHGNVAKCHYCAWYNLCTCGHCYVHFSRQCVNN